MLYVRLLNEDISDLNTFRTKSPVVVHDPVKSLPVTKQL